MILVTGAGGKTGKAVLERLSEKGEAVRALAHREGQIAFSGTVVADLLDPAGMKAAMEGVQVVYLIAPNMHPDETGIGEIAIAAAREAGVERLVYHSVLHPQTREMPHHWQKLAVEERLFESGLEFTILQPAAYMQNLLAYWDEIVETGVYRVPYGESSALSLVDLEDVAEVSAEVLTDEGHDGAIYELAGPEALTPHRMAEVLSGQLAREIRSEKISLQAWIERARTDGLSGYALDSLTKMFRYYDRCGLIGNSKVLEILLGRPSTTFEQFVERTTGS